MKIVTVIGARPQFIKAAVLSRKFTENNNIQELIIHTGQHFDANMSNVFFEEMGIPTPDFFLGVNSTTHGSMTAKMLEAIEAVLLKVNPDWVLVYGDTNSTLAGALAAIKLGIKIAHVESGLRSFNINMPEEINRILTDRISNLLFCPSESAIKNLSLEGFTNNKNCKIFLVGDIMEDASIIFANKAKPPLNCRFSSNYVLATLHRAENTDSKEKLSNIINAFKLISSVCNVILPLHPRTRNALINWNIDTNGIEVIEPVGYLNMIWLIQNSNLILTDSGGLQKEAYFYNKYCITLRCETEWIELIENGYNFLIGDNTERIVSQFNFLYGKEFVKSHEFYGGGAAADKIVKNLINYGD